MTINPALDDVSYCPRCRRPAEVVYPRSLTCAHCGYGAYYNPKPVAAAIPRDDDGRIVLLRRAFDPGAGLWTFPGGFVDLGESVEDGARREGQEELHVDLALGELVGIYSRAEDRVVLIVWTASVADEPQTSEEAVEV